MNLGNLIDSLYFPCNPHIQQNTTKEQYGYAAADFKRMLGRDPVDSDLTNENLSRLSGELLRRGLAPKTINERVGRLAAVWRWLSRQGRLGGWPCYRRIPEPLRVPLAYSRDQLTGLFAAFDSLTGTIDGVPERDWWLSLHYAAWDSSERITALMKCKTTFLSGEWLSIPAEVRKQRTSDRTYRLAEDTLAVIAKTYEAKPNREMIWPWPYDPKYLWSRYRTLRRRVGLPTDRRSSFHRIRKSVASHVKAAGGDPQAVLGHTDPRVTAAYLDPRVTGTPQAIDFLFRPGS